MIRLTILLALACAAFPALAQIYQIDPRHSHVSWAAAHFGVSTYRGKFTRSSGSLTIERAANTGSVQVVIDAASQQSGDDRLDKHLSGEDFFNVAKFPTVTFGAPSVQLVGEAPARVPGTLTMLGVTRPVTLEISRFRCMDHPFQKTRELCGGDATVTIKRSEWGMKHLIPAVSDDIRLDIQLEAVREK